MSKCKVIAIANQKGGTGKLPLRSIRDRTCKSREKGSSGGR